VLALIIVVPLLLVSGILLSGLSRDRNPLQNVAKYDPGVVQPDPTAFQEAVYNSSISALPFAPDKGESKVMSRKWHRLIVAATGDVMMQRRCNLSAEQQSRGDANDHGYFELFRRASLPVKAADLAMANLEFPVFERKQPEDPYVFNAPRPVLSALARTGFDALNCANNHSYDHGPKGPSVTSGLCDKEGLQCLGIGPDQDTAHAPHFIEKNGMKLAFIGYTVHHNSDYNRRDSELPHVNGYSFGTLVRQVRKADEQSDCVVVSIHWGDEYQTVPLPEQTIDARRLVDAGACLVVGHHPHVLAPIKPLRMNDGRRALVAYSLGNFFSNQGDYSVYSTLRVGAILQVEIELTSGGGSVASWTSVPTWLENRDINASGRLIEDVHVEVPCLEIEHLQTLLADAKNEIKRQKIEKKIRFYKGRINLAEKMLANPHGTSNQGDSHAVLYNRSRLGD